MIFKFYNGTININSSFGGVVSTTTEGSILNTNSSLFKLRPYNNLGKWLGRTYFPLYDETNKKTYLAVINNEIVQLSSSEAIPAGTYKIDIVLPRQIAY